MQKTVFYLVHEPSDKRIRYYNTQGGARIAARNRNRHLGFYTRIDKLHIDNTEYELYIVDDHVVTGSYAIQEDYIEMENLYE